MGVAERYPSYVSDQRRFFDELVTEEWQSYLSAEWDYRRRFEVRQLFRRIQPACILDVGCGCGYHDLAMAEYPFVQRVDAIDYSAQSIAKADLVYPHPKVHRQVADFTTFQPLQTYALVVSFYVFEHLPDPDAFMDFCVRRSAPGGWVGVVTPNRQRLGNRWRQWRGRTPALLDVMHFREYTLPELRDIGLRHGLTDTHCFGHGIAGGRLPRLGSWGASLAVRLGAVCPAWADAIGMVWLKPRQPAT